MLILKASPIFFTQKLKLIKRLFQKQMNLAKFFFYVSFPPSPAPPPPFSRLLMKKKYTDYNYL